MVAIAVETGVQNAGIAIMLLRVGRGVERGGGGIAFMLLKVGTGTGVEPLYRFSRRTSAKKFGIPPPSGWIWKGFRARLKQKNSLITLSPPLASSSPNLSTNSPVHIDILFSSMHFFCSFRSRSRTPTFRR